MIYIIGKFRRYGCSLATLCKPRSRATAKFKLCTRDCYGICTICKITACSIRPFFVLNNRFWFHCNMICFQSMPTQTCNDLHYLLTTLISNVICHCSRFEAPKWATAFFFSIHMVPMIWDTILGARNSTITQLFYAYMVRICVFWIERIWTSFAKFQTPHLATLCTLKKELIIMSCGNPLLRNLWQSTNKACHSMRKLVN